MADRYLWRVYPAGGTSPVATVRWAEADVACDLPSTAATADPLVVTNPSVVRWTDPLRPTRECQARLPVSGDFVALPAGTYEGTLVRQTGAGEASDESSRVRFDMAVRPPVILGVRVVK
jgi:hypothetical protein